MTTPSYSVYSTGSRLCRLSAATIRVFSGIGFRQDSRFVELVQHVVIAISGDKN
jgi:hypothetical protein